MADLAILIYYCVEVCLSQQIVIFAIEENLIHLFYECEYVMSFWREMLNYLIFDIGYLNYCYIIMGQNVFDPEPLMKYIILLGNKHYKCKVIRSKPNLF